MRDMLIFSVAMFAMTALIEFLVLTRYVASRGYRFCVLSAAILSGVLGLDCSLLLIHVRWGWKAASEPPAAGADWIVLGFLLLIDAILASAVALIPAGVVALIHQRLRTRA